MKPKVELHLHLEGAAPPAFIRSLAKEKHLDLAGLFNEDGSYRFKDFWDFIKVYEAAVTTLQRPEDFHRLTLAVLEESARSGVIYTEAFLAPDFCGGRDIGAWKEYLHAIEEAAAIAEATMGITMRGIVTTVRHFGPDKARQTARCAAETAGQFVTGFGLAGDEKVLNPKDFAYAFDMAREAGLSLTAHAGEFGGPQSIRDAPTGSATVPAPSRIWPWSTNSPNRRSRWSFAPAPTSPLAFTPAFANTRLARCTGAASRSPSAPMTRPSSTPPWPRNTPNCTTPLTGTTAYSTKSPATRLTPPFVTPIRKP